jgi:hypothetical protein
MILTSYIYVGVHYKKKNGVSQSKLAPVSIVTLWITVHCFQQQSVITTCIRSVTIVTGANLLETPLFFL